MPDSDPARAVNALIVGGGVAALETVIALHELASDRVRATLVAPEDHFTYRPLTVAEPFSLGHAERHPLERLADDFGARVLRDAVSEVLPDQHRVRCASGAEHEYDVLVVAVGARAASPFRRGVTFGQPGSHAALKDLVADVEQGYTKRVAFVVPPGTSWPLPLYELALMTAGEVYAQGIEEAELTLVSTEPSPLSIFGTTASATVAALLADAGIEFIGGSYATMEDRQLVLAPRHRTLDVGRVVTLPVLLGPDLAGLPGDSSGFIPVDEHGRVTGLEDVYAAGDATTFPVKQGGIATQQADAVAESIAARAGAPVTPAPMRPVLRGVLMTGGEHRFLRHALTGGQGEGASAKHALWWPPNKIAGRYLSPYLFGRDEDAVLGLGGGPHVPVAVSVWPAAHTQGDPDIELLGDRGD